MTQEQATRHKKQKAEAVPLIISSHEASQLLAEQLIKDYHDSLAEANFIFLCRNKPIKQGGRTVGGTVKKANPLERHLGGHLFPEDKEPDFIMMISLDEWNAMAENPRQRQALVDHLLTRCVGDEQEDGSYKYSIRAAQVQEFPEVVERNGRWNADLQEMGNCLQGK